MAMGGSMTDTTVASTRHSPSVSSAIAADGSPQPPQALMRAGQTARGSQPLSAPLSTFAPDRVM